MINRAGNKEKAKRVLNENGNLSGMVGMEILYRVIAAITSVLLGAMIAGGIGVVSAVVSAPFKLFGLAGIIIAYVLITPIATLVGAIAGGAVAGPFEVARYRYYLSLRKNGIRPKVTCIFDAFDFFMQFALVTGVRMLTIMWIPVLICYAVAGGCCCSGFSELSGGNAAGDDRHDCSSRCCGLPFISVLAYGSGAGRSSAAECRTGYGTLQGNDGRS